MTHLESGKQPVLFTDVSLAEMSLEGQGLAERVCGIGVGWSHSRGS